ncbi:HET-domain-containing protein [Plenodomus tracheiphilus IPT5]|uniref:HET-domain-containing protein n=1 Tax=Plenodomus tracheiphilus IPT5 TaxID=1408161 RepID=A0A6A7AZZ2_9PLEO|nr:HET-domain-containing protein [Plenodomus tracheiphilus IPT5]
MSFCSVCEHLPFRDLFGFRPEGYIGPDPFQHFLRPELGDYPGNELRPFIKWHMSIAQLQSNGETCAFCDMIISNLQTSYHYRTNVKVGDDRAVWLSSRSDATILSVYLGDERPRVKISGNFWFSTTPDSPVADFIIKHDVIASSIHPMVLGKIEDWLEQCNNTHESCSRVDAHELPLPTRLLDLGSLPDKKALCDAGGDPKRLLDITSLKLVELPPGSKGLYVALSYCWGKTLAYTTTSKNLAQHKQDGGITYVSLPKTIQDAIFLVRRLGFRYLWADCVCIVQDDTADWEQEASRMSDVYTNAAFTIAATRASHCGEGFLQPRDVKDRKVISFPDKYGSFDLHSYYDDLTAFPGSMDVVVDDEVAMRKNGPLLDRVWCFQERVLATRTIHFASDQMYWECPDHMEEEKGYTRENTEYILRNIANGLKIAMHSEHAKLQTDTDTKPHDAAEGGRRAWYRMLEGYTSRDMTYQSDKLPALSGVLSALQKMTGDICYVGIWKSWFLKGLLWRLQVPDQDSYVFTPRKAHRVDKWRAPSWSFASLEGVVVYNLLENDPGRELCTSLEECIVVPKGKNPLGELESGFAKLKGPVTTLYDVASDATSLGRTCTVRMTEGLEADGSVYFDLELHNQCEVLMITPHTGLAIVPVGAEEGVYVRVGAVSVYRKPGNGVEAKEPAFEYRDRFLCAADYPRARSLTLV